jgi:hypothetical protein
VAARNLTLLGQDYQPGDAIKEGADNRVLRRMYEARRINFGEAAQAAPLVTKTGGSGGSWSINAPWLDEPIKVRGVANADAMIAQLTEEGPPLGWIPGGSDVTLIGGEGGWYEISAPWLDEPEKVQGREAAEARQRVLHAEGEPVEHHGVTLTPGENGWWTVIANWDPDNSASVHGEEAARELATNWRAEGPPADPVTVTPGDTDGEFVITTAWSDEKEVVVGQDAATARAAEIRAAGAPDPVTVEPGLVTSEAEGKFVVSAPWLETPEVFDTRDAADARAAELREAGPPDPAGASGA